MSIVEYDIEKINYQGDMTDWSNFTFSDGNFVYTVVGSDGHQWKCEKRSVKQTILYPKSPAEIVYMSHIDILPYYLTLVLKRMNAIKEDLKNANEYIGEMQDQVTDTEHLKDIEIKYTNALEVQFDFLDDLGLVDLFDHWRNISIDQTLKIRKAIEEAII